MKRRGLLAFFGAAPLAGRPAQAQREMPVVGFMNPVSPDTYAFNAAAFREGLAEAGFVEGRNVRIEYRWAKGDYAQLPAPAAELAEPRPALLPSANEVIR